MLDGTSHQGLKMAPVITAESCGVGVLERAGHRAPAVQGLAVLDQGDRVGGHVHDHIFGAEVARQPAPAVEVDPDPVAGLGINRRVGEQALERRILRMGRKQPVQGLGDIALYRAVEQSLLVIDVPAVVLDVPVEAVGAADMAEHEVAGELEEGRGGDAVEHVAFGLDRVAKRGRIVVGGIETFLVDPLDESEQSLGLLARPVGGDDGRRGRGKRRCDRGLGRRGGGVLGGRGPSGPEREEGEKAAAEHGLSPWMAAAKKLRVAVRHYPGIAY